MARAQARATGATISWRPTAQGYTFSGVPDTAKGADQLHPSYAWLHEGIHAQIEQPAATRSLLLGPEPVIPAQTVAVRLDGRTIRLGTDGLRPFAPVPEPHTAVAP